MTDIPGVFVVTALLTGYVVIVAAVRWWRGRKWQRVIEYRLRRVLRPVRRRK